jgi:hypothetical protein
MDKFFSAFGKIIFGIIIVGILAGGGYYFGSQFGEEQKDIATQSTQNLTPTTTPSPTIAPKQIVTSGLGNIEGVNFPKYQIAVPFDWTVEKEHSEEQSPLDVLTISKSGYKLKIFQAATGGAMCQYPGDAAFEGPSSTYTIFKELSDSEGRIYRRSGSETLSKDGTRGFTLCHKSEYGWQQPSPYGHVGYTLPGTYDVQILEEMDGMIQTLKKI